MPAKGRETNTGVAKALQQSTLGTYQKVGGKQSRGKDMNGKIVVSDEPTNEDGMPRVFTVNGRLVQSKRHCAAGTLYICKNASDVAPVHICPKCQLWMHGPCRIELDGSDIPTKFL